jgi:cyclomaltodextrinase / maltogenic alpha-amylase / neopullulanase
MLAEGLYHTAGGGWAYAYDSETIHLRLRTRLNDAEDVFVLLGDKYDWENTQEEYGMERIAADHWFDYWQAAVKPSRKRMVYSFRLQGGDEVLWLTDGGAVGEAPSDPGECFEYPYLHESELFRVPEWAKEAVFYQIMPDRFGPPDKPDDTPGILPWGDPPRLDASFGGNLKGIEDNLEYLTELGINALYLTPVFASPSCHKYDISDYKQVDPLLGGKEQLKSLVEQCHKQGIRVVLDAVFNHCSEQFKPFLDVLEHGEASAYTGWFHIHSYPIRGDNGEPHYETFGNFGHMPKLNTSDPGVREYLFDVVRYWMEETGIDGWRLDVANEIDHSFWRDFRRLVKSINPEAYIVGESWSTAGPWLVGDQFDSAMNYPLTRRILDYFLSDRLDGAGFAGSISRLSVRYPQQAHEVLFNLLGSHDTGRISSIMEDKRKRKHAVLFLLTYPGTPCIFYGDEYGMMGGDDPDCRKCMEWDPDRRDGELMDFYRKLIWMRRSLPALSIGRYRMLRAEPGDPAIIYERVARGSHVLVWLNHSEEPAEVSLGLETDDWSDAWTEERVPVENGSITLQLDSFSFRILKRSWTEDGG